MNKLFDPDTPTTHRPVGHSKFLDLTRCRIVDGVYTPRIFPDGHFQDPGMAATPKVVVCTPFGNFAARVNRYCSDEAPGWFLSVFGLYDTRFDLVRAWTEALAFADEHGVEWIYWDDLIHVGTPRSRMEQRLRADLAAAEAHTASIRSTMQGLGISP